MIATKCIPKNGVCDLLVDWRDFESVCFSIPSRDGQILTSFFAIFGPFCMWIHGHSDYDMRMYLQVHAYAHVSHVAESAWPSLVLTEADYTQDNAHIILCPQCN